MLVHEWRGVEFIRRGTIVLDSRTRPTKVAYNATRQLLAWSEGTSSNAVHLVTLAAIGRRMELRSDVPGLVPSIFSSDGKYLVARTQRGDSLRVWNVETGQTVASIGNSPGALTFAAGGQVLVAAIVKGGDHEICFDDLNQADQAPRRVPGKLSFVTLAVSPDGGLVASGTESGLVRLFDPAKAERVADLHGHLFAANAISFSSDGRRLFSTSCGREAVKLWDVGTGQELLTLGGTGSALYGAYWSADGDVILAGAPWQASRASSWEEIAEAEAKEKMEIHQQ